MEGPGAPTARRAMRRLRMTQREFAHAIDANIDRVKNLATGRVKSLTFAEMRLLIDNYGVSSDFLLTGRPPVLKAAS